MSKSRCSSFVGFGCGWKAASDSVGCVLEQYCCSSSKCRCADEKFYDVLRSFAFQYYQTNLPDTKYLHRRVEDGTLSKQRPSELPELVSVVREKHDFGQFAQQRLETSDVSGEMGCHDFGRCRPRDLWKIHGDDGRLGRTGSWRLLVLRDEVVPVAVILPGEAFDVELAGSDGASLCRTTLESEPEAEQDPRLSAEIDREHAGMEARGCLRQE